MQTIQDIQAAVRAANEQRTQALQAARELRDSFLEQAREVEREFPELITRGRRAGVKISEETRQKMAAAAKRRAADPEWRRKNSAGTRAYWAKRRRALNGSGEQISA